MQGGKEIIVMQRESMKTLKLILEKKINVENKEDSFQHKDSYGSKRSGVQYMNRKSIQIQMSSLLSKLLSAGQKGTMYNIPERMAQNKRSVLVKLKDEKDSISYPNRKKKKKKSPTRWEAAGDICGKINKLVMKNQATVFSTTVWLMTL